MIFAGHLLMLILINQIPRKVSFTFIVKFSFLAASQRSFEKTFGVTTSKLKFHHQEGIFRSLCNHPPSKNDSYRALQEDQCAQASSTQIPGFAPGTTLFRPCRLSSDRYDPHEHHLRWCRSQQNCAIGDILPRGLHQLGLVRRGLYRLRIRSIPRCFPTSRTTAISNPGWL